ncbi:MAG: amino acid adenylation domain-containing protein [Candidatus Promineifilaceae bacterium]
MTQSAMKHAGASKQNLLLDSLGHVKKQAPALEALLNSVGKLWQAGFDIDWQAFYAEETRRTVQLPTYPFERQRYWVEPPPLKKHQSEKLKVESEMLDIEQPLATLHLPLSTTTMNRRNRIRETLNETLTELSGIEIDSAEFDTSFIELGYDSLTLTQVSTLFKRQLGVPIKFRRLLEDISTLNLLADYFAEKLPADQFAEEEVVKSQEPAVNSPQPAMATNGHTNGSNGHAKGANGYHPAPAQTPPAPAPQPQMPMQPMQMPQMPMQPMPMQQMPQMQMPQMGGMNPMLMQQMMMQMMMQQQMMLMSGMMQQPMVNQQMPVANYQQPVAPTPAPTSQPQQPQVNKPQAAGNKQQGAGSRKQDAHLPNAPQYNKTQKVNKKAFGPYVTVPKGEKGQLTAAQAAHLKDLTERMLAKTGGSRKLAQAYRDVHADPRGIAAFRQLWKDLVYQIAVERSKGSKVWDVDGNDYVDITMGFGINFFGHSPDFIQQAMHAQTDTGIHIGPQDTISGDVARLVREITGMQRVSFCNTGSEAVMAAIRMARTQTGRDKIVFFNGDYHGVFDEVLARPQIRKGKLHTAPAAPGITHDSVKNTYILEYGEDASLEFIRAHAHELAAVVIEPVQSRHPNNRPKQFIHNIRRITEQSGTAMVFDEVITGFRVHPRGMQHVYGVKPDICAYGKIVGGGMPIGVVAGNPKFMDGIDGGMWQYGDDSIPEADLTFFAGTFVRHPLTMAAARAVLTRIKAEGPALQERVSGRMTAFASEMNAFFVERQVPIRVNHFSSWFRFEAPADIQYKDLLFYHLLEKGVYVFTFFQNCFFSTEHSDADIERIKHAIKQGVIELQAAGFLPAPVNVVTGTFPLTDTQRDMLFESQLTDAAATAFNESFKIRLRGALHLADLQAAVQATVQRHAALHLRFSPAGDWQKLADDRQLPMALFDWSDLDSAEKQRQLSAEIDRAMTTPFDLQKGPLIRINLYKLSENEHVFQWVAHHIVYDGWSAVIIIDEIRDRYNGLVTGTKFELESADSFRDYVEWEQAISESDEGQAALIYWKTQFPQLPPALDLPTDRPHGAVKTYASQSFHYEFDASLVGKIRKAAVASKSSLFVTLLSAYKVLLHRLTTQTDIVVGTPLAGQAISDYGDLVGSCVNLLPMRTQIDSEQSFAELAKTVRGTFLDAQDNIPIPFSHIVRDLTIAQGKPPVPLVEMVFNLDRRLPTSEFHGLQQEIREVPKRSTDWKIFFNLYEEDDLLKADLEYNSDLFDQTTIHRWLTHYETLLRSISAEPAARIRDLNILSPAQRHEIVNEWNATTAPFRDQATVQQLFTEQAIRTPNATALRYKNDSISYRQLEQRSNQLANFLETKGVASGSVVGIALERSIDLVVGLLGVLKAGGTYVALDPTYPLDRLNHMAETAQAVLLLSNRASLQSIPTSREVVVLDRDWPQIAAFSDSAPKTFVTADDAMYITFTSGTTGMPKGIAGHHRGVINRCAWQWQAFPFEANEICVQKTTLNFVDSLWELWGPLLQGVELLIVADEELKDFGRFVDILASHNVHRLTLVPSLGQALLEQYPNLQTRLPKLKYWTFSGEAITRGLQERFERVLPHAVLLNFYGMSEASIDVCFYDSRHGIQAPNTPIGKPISNMQLYVLNNALNPVPVGVPGEIFVGGVGVMDSYLGLESLSAEKFLPNSFTHTGKLYRTGDIGRWMANGMLEYLGRRDQQVKLRGIRVELGEIESTLLQHPAIDQAVVVAKETAGGDKQLFAYSVLRRSKREPSSAELRDHLKATLPDYMLPTTFVTLGDLPRTPNGKVNREKLPAPMGMELPRGKTTVVLSSAARDALEFSLAQMWRSILNLPKVGINDNFFELGGHSLAAMRLFAQIHEQHEIRLPISTLFTAPTISKLADCIRETGWENEWSSLVPIQTVGNKTPFFCVGAFHINIVSLNALGQELGRPFYGLQPLGLADSAEFNLPYDQIADRYIQEIKSVQPTGPYLLGGHCSGSWLAYEVARQLESRGDKVDLLAVIGGMSPTYQEPEITGLSYYSKRLQSYWQTKDLWNVVKWETKNRLEKLQLNRVQSPQKRQQVEVISAYEQAHDTYPTQVQAGFNGNTFVMYPTEQAAINSSTPYYAWQDLTTGSLELAEIESTHGLLLRDPVVKTLGAKLREQIDASIV